jgi:hypothetical protein
MGFRVMMMFLFMMMMMMVDGRGGENFIAIPLRFPQSHYIRIFFCK